MNTEFKIQDSRFKIQDSQGKASDFKNSEEKKLKKLTSEFESVFLYYMIKTMRDTVPKSGFIHGKSGEEIYRSMMDQELAKSMSERGKSEISETMFKQLTNKK